ncbi:hypothetical protein SASPL_128388 [Salvia splendens]|uniref:Uncharacterized protein n=1 Tax=Salvia splendens TaxID=180675 RepID=A0A8X8XDP8_SALSN|nr:hypothetical protein SASPL_128388 [Salvia splendens]
MALLSIFQDLYLIQTLSLSLCVDAKDVNHVNSTKHNKPPFLCFQEQLLRAVILCESSHLKSKPTEDAEQPHRCSGCEDCGAAQSGVEVHMDGEEKNIGVGLEQSIPGHGTIPLSPYFFWPRKDACEELKATLQSKPWISHNNIIILLHQSLETNCVLNSTLLCSTFAALLLLQTWQDTTHLQE